MGFRTADVGWTESDSIVRRVCLSAAYEHRIESTGCLLHTVLYADVRPETNRWRYSVGTHRRKSVDGPSLEDFLKKLLKYVIILILSTREKDFLIQSVSLDRRDDDSWQCMANRWGYDFKIASPRSAGRQHPTSNSAVFDICTHAHGPIGGGGSKWWEREGMVQTLYAVLPWLDEGSTISIICLWDFRYFFLKREGRDVIFEKLGVLCRARYFFYVGIILLLF